MAVVARLKRLYQDDVTADVVCGHDKIVLATRVDKETIHVVGVEFADGLKLRFLDLTGVGGVCRVVTRVGVLGLEVGMLVDVEVGVLGLVTLA